ncbi:MAG TPA: hypothetical protein VGI24_04635 [Solirubrobacteraceae bacterium]|jgi:hypothetical protein
MLAGEDRELVEAVARRVVELLDERSSQSGRKMVSAKALAVELEVSLDFVYAHADELGGIRIGGGSKPRLRFDAQTALEHHESTTRAVSSSEQSSPSRSRRRRATVRNVALLPVRGLSE